MLELLVNRLPACYTKFLSGGFWTVRTLIKPKKTLNRNPEPRNPTPQNPKPLSPEAYTADPEDRHRLVPATRLPAARVG